MDEQSHQHSLLNVYEVVEAGVHRHFVCFMEPRIAGVEGIDQRAVIGEFTPGADGDFDAETFVLNPGFLDAFTGYMNEEAATSPRMREEASRHASDWLYVADPRWEWVEGKEPGSNDLLGRFAVGDDGQIETGSFVYNALHQWFDADSGVSGALFDRRFHDWLHKQPRP